MLKINLRKLYNFAFKKFNKQININTINPMISAVISTHNNFNYLKNCISSIINNTTLISEIIVYAENCTDDTDSYLLELQTLNSKIKIYIEHNTAEHIRGIGGGINYAISKITNEYFILLHSDMYIIPGYDLELYNYFKNNTNDERLIVSSWRIEPDLWNNSILTPGVVTVPKNTFGELHSNFNSDLFNNWCSDFCKQNYNKAIRSAGGAGGFMMKKSDWIFLGGNDDIFRPACYEDIDLFVRAQIKDFKFIMTMNTVCYHFGGRGSHFPNDNFEKKSDRQQIAESTGLIKWLEKWNEIPKKDNHGLVVVTNEMIEYKNKNLNKYIY